MARAQARPDAGQTLESLRPAPALPGTQVSPLPRSDQRPALDADAGQRIPLREIHVTGARVFPAVELEALLRDAVGKEVSIAELSALAARITAHYRTHGYLLSRAYVPAQEIREGRVEIAVLEGSIAQVRVDNATRLSDGVAQSHVAGLRDPARAAQVGVVERSLLLLNDLPGVVVSSMLKPGAEVGSADLDLSLRPRALFSGSLDLDNTGNRYTGEYRAGANLNLNNGAGLGDLANLRLIDTGPGMQYARAGWQLPLGGDGLKLGAAYSTLRYRLGRDFETLGAHGNARVAGLWATYPMERSQARNLSLQLSYDQKRLEDLVDATASDSRKTLRVWTLGLAGDASDSLGGGGASVYSLGIVSGRLGLDDTSHALDQGAVGLRTAGGYGKLSFNLMRLQALTRDISLYAALSGQAAAKNLDSSEKLSLGGAYGVRAYPQGEAAGDDAAILNLELRYTLAGTGEMQMLSFVDAGAARTSHDAPPADGNNRRHLRGAGVGLQWQRSASFAFKAYLAWREGARPQSDSDRNPRLWLAFSTFF